MNNQKQSCIPYIQPPLTTAPPVLPIVYKDDDLIAINKPHGLLVHRSRIARNATAYALQLLRDQIGRRVYPIHRLDRKTSGVLLFALEMEPLKLMQQKFAKNEVRKNYLAIVRGYTEDQGEINHPITRDDGKVQDAFTAYRTLAKVELSIPLGKHQSSRYSLVKVSPRSGRTHQIRKHFNHLRHPIIGDRPHGCNKQNKLFKEKWQMTTMMLHAHTLDFIHPKSGEACHITAPISPEFERVAHIMHWGHEIAHLP